MSEWKETELSKIGTVVSGGTPSTVVSEFWNGDILFVTPYDLSRNKSAFIEDTERKISKEGLTNSSATILPVGSIVISSRAPIGYIAIGKKEFTTNQGCKSLIPNPNFDSLYLYYCFNFYVERIKRFGEGTTFAEISKGDLELVKFPHPINKNEQHHIALILSTADAVIEKTQATVAKYKAIKQGMLNDLFTRGIDIQTGKLRPKYEDSPELYKESKLGWIPNEWEVEKIGDFSFVTKLAGFEYTIYFDYSKSGSIIAVRALNIKHGKLALNNVHTIPKETSDALPRSQLQKGDLVISYVGTVGEVAVVPENNKFHLAPNVAKISVDRKILDPFFLNQFLNSDIGQNEIMKLVSSTTQAALSMQNLREVKFLKPDLKEQKEIAKRLENIDNNIETEQAYLVKLQRLMAGLMGDLLSGKKKVNVNEVAEIVNQ